MDYWCAEQIVVTVEGPAGQSEVSVAQPFARVGSHPESEVVIADSAVARRCLYLHATPEGLFCLFLDIAPADVAQFDTQHNGIWLRPDQEVMVGEHRIRARRLAAEEGAPLPEENLAAWGSAPPPLPVLMVHCGGLLKDKRRLRARLSPLGRRPQCGLQLKGKKVSSFHCVLYWDQEQLWCIDLLSSNGTSLNGDAIACARVAIGDRLDVGEFGLVFQRLSGGGQPRRSDELPEPERGAATDERSENAPALLAAAAVVAGPTPELLAQLEEERQLRHQLAEEVARLKNEQQERQSHWDQESQALQAQIGQLQEEASRRADERQALEASRGQWSDQQAALTSQLEERSGEAARLQSELTAAAASLANRSAELAAQRQAIEKLHQDWQAERQSLTEQLTARAEQFARREADLAAANDEFARQQAATDEQAQAAETTPIAQFPQAQTAQATVEPGLEPDTDAWQVERESLAGPLADRQLELTRQQAELSDAERGFVQPPTEESLTPLPLPIEEPPAEELDWTDSEVPLEAPDEPIAEPLSPEPPAPFEVEPSSAASDSADTPPEEWNPDDISIAAEDDPEPLPITIRHAADSDDLEEMKLLVSERIGKKPGPASLRWLWWSAGGVGVAAVVAVIVIVVLWVF